MSGQRQWRWCVWLLAVWVPALAAQEPPMPTIQEVKVPADQPARWPRGNWQPVPLSEYLRVKSLAMPGPGGPRTARIELAEYEATVAGDTLRNGTLTAQIKRSPEAPPLLPLDPMNLAVTSFRWPHRPAVWGTTPQGDTALLVDQTEATLYGEWNLQGRKLSQHVEFDIQLASATVSRLILRLPDGYQLRSSVGFVSGPADTDSPAWKSWTVDLGSQSRSRLTVSEPAAAGPRPAVVLGDVKSSYVITQADCRFQTAVMLDVFEAPLNVLTFRLPLGMEVDSISYGTDAPLTWRVLRRSDPQPSQTLTVELPDPLLGRSRPVRIQGRVPPELNTFWSLPQLQLRDATTLTNQITLEVTRPLQLQSLNLTGYRQTAYVSQGVQGELVTFEQEYPGGRLALRLGRPPLSTSAEILTTLRLTKGAWKLEALARFRSRSGSAFRLRFHCSPGWEITSVQTGPDQATPINLEWEIQDDANGRILTVDLSEALDADRPVTLGIQGRRVPSPLEQTFELPILQPLEAEAVSRVLVVYPSRDIPLQLRPSVVFQTHPPTELTQLSPLARQLTEPLPPDTLILSSSALSATAELERVPPPELPQPAPPVPPAGPGVVVPASEQGELQLRSQLATVGHAPDLHEATYKLPARPRQTTFSFSLPDQCELLEVSLNWQTVTPIRNGAQLEISCPPGDEANEIRLTYRCASAEGKLLNRRAIPIPTTPFEITRFDWELGLPRQLTLREPPADVLMLTPQPQPGWTQRLFGPLGRPLHAGIFHPFRRADWENLSLTPAPPERESVTALQFFAPGVPEELSLETWSTSGQLGLAWLLLLGCLLGGCALRTLRVDGHHLWLGLGVGVLLIFAVVAPACWAEIAGGGFFGGLLSMLLPRRFFFQEKPVELSPELSVGSTQHYVIPASFGLILLSVLLSEADGQNPFAPPEKVVIVLVPDVAAETPASMVYMAEADWKTLQESARVSRDWVPWLISSADYKATLDAQHTLSLQASYQISTLTSDPLVEVLLPIKNANLGGASACQVDGQPHPVLRSPDDRGFLIELPNKLPLEAPVPDVTGLARQAHRTTVQTHQIVLQLYPPVQLNGKRGQTSITIPPVAASRLVMNYAPDLLTLNIPSARGGITRQAAERRLVAEIGRTDQLQIYWSDQAEPLRKPMTLEARSRMVVTVHPTRLECHCRLWYKVLKGEADYVTLHLPPGSVVRSLEAPELLTYSLQTDANRVSRLLAEFASPRTDQFTLDLFLTLPVTLKNQTISTPSLDVIPETPEGSDSVKVTSRAVAFTAPSRFRLRDDTLNQERLVSITAETFWKDWETRRFWPTLPPLDFVYRLTEPTGFELKLESLLPKRSVRMNQTGTVRPGLLKWELVAELTTTRSPAFQHQLTVPPDLLIESLSVKEDGAERLVRWSRNASQVVLFLDSSTMGIQTITLTGRLPVTTGRLTTLPAVGVDDATVEASELILYRQPQTRVLIPGVKPADEMPGSDQKSSERQLVARYPWTPGTVAPQVEVVAAEPSRLVDGILWLVPEGEDRWTWSTLLVFPADLSLGPLEMEIPAPWAEKVAWKADGCTVQSAMLPNGSTRLTFAAPGGSPRRGLVTLSGPLPAVPDKTLPWPTLLWETGRWDQLFIYPPLNSPWHFAKREAIIPADELPAWIPPQFRGSPLQELTGWPREFAPTAGQSELKLPLLKTELWLGENFQLRGRTTLLLTGGNQSTLNLDWPTATTLEQVWIDGHPRPQEPPTDGQLPLALPDLQAVTLIQLDWKASAEISAQPLSADWWRFPRPLTPQPRESLVVLRSPYDLSYIPRSGTQKLSRAAFEKRHLEGLLVYAEAGWKQEHRPPAPELRQELRRVYRILDAQREGAAPDLQAAIRALLIRTEEFLNQVQPEVPGPNPDLQLQASAPVRALIDEEAPGLYLGELAAGPENRLYGFWVLRDQKMSWCVGGVAMLILLPILFKLRSWQVPDWLGEHPVVGWGLLGVIWWLCLRLSLFGFVLVVAVLLTTLLYLIRRPRRQGGNSELHLPG